MDRGDVEKAHGLIRRMIREGHIVANHTTNHFNLCGVKEETAAAEIDRAEQSIARVAEMPVPWFRAPYGAYCQRLVGQLAARGRDHFHWDVDPQEWRHGSPKRTVAYVTRRMAWSPGRNVILLHDIHVVTVRALPKILAWLDDENAKRAKKGRRPVRIVDAPAYAAERVAPGVLAWLRETADEAGALAGRLAAAAIP
jgi:peptidoglycan/xylan/chitin deacetylase (PgdA/CDA1 family)